MSENLSHNGPEQDPYYQVACDGVIEALSSIFNPENGHLGPDASQPFVVLDYLLETPYGYDKRPGEYIRIDDEIDLNARQRHFDVQIVKVAKGFERVIAKGKFEENFNDNPNRATMESGSIYKIHNALANFIDYRSSLS